MTSIFFYNCILYSNIYFFISHHFHHIAIIMLQEPRQALRNCCNDIIGR